MRLVEIRRHPHAHRADGAGPGAKGGTGGGSSFAVLIDSSLSAVESAFTAGAAGLSVGGPGGAPSNAGAEGNYARLR